MKNVYSIAVKDLWKKLGVNQALAGVSLNFEEAKMHGVIGPEGAGYLDGRIGCRRRIA